MGVVELWKMLVAGHIDFVGQKQAFYLIWSAGLVGFVYGFVMQRFLYTFYIIFGATMVAVLVCLPSWPWWNRNGLSWLEPLPEEDAAGSKTGKDGKDAKKGGGKKSS
eukprot:CAMPEP_0178468768 /NCGR_PEP_ID=MMETSP0689_2-20121128/53086_1 /TAXON_ID=160604 /ORGANISM="Amphidinium massartii, Strain CS-259" /LENGTH=106 /DNA_ID=CAMNT_0020095827 /DNA_START=36 /DNA_END=356 /DNA_ORIENTATION=+